MTTFKYNRYECGMLFQTGKCKVVLTNKIAN